MSGETRWVHVDKVPWRDIEGAIIGVLMFIYDITDRKRAEDEIKRYSEHLEELVEARSQDLRSAKERLEYVIESNPAVVYLGKPLPDFTHFYSIYKSKNVVSLTGFESEEFIGEKGVALWESRIHPEDLISYKAGIPELWKKGHQVCEYRFRHKNGTYRWIREEVNLSRDPSGNVRDVIGYWSDVTERKRMEEDLQVANKRLEYVIESNPATIYSGKPLSDYSDWHMTYISGRITGMTGFEPLELIDHPGFWNSRIHPDDLRSYLAEIPRLFKDGHWSTDYRFLCKDGAYRWIREEVKSIRDADGKPFEVVGCWTDITELKEMERRLTQTEHLAGIGEAAAMVGHDLRNPLQAISGAIYLLRDESIPAKERNEMLQLIEDSVDYSNGIVNDLLDYAGTLTLNTEDTSPKKIVTSALTAIRFPSKIKVLDQSQEQPVISADPDRMKRVLINLIENAVDAMPSGGTLAISSREWSGSVQLRISDTGRGMPKEVLENLWKPLQTTKAKGMGIGLAIVKRIIEAHDGEIGVESKTGEGTTFTIRLPIKRRKITRSVPKRTAEP
jgi:PAS domain S-box-containing protein